jgi:hypothetical protein
MSTHPARIGRAAALVAVLMLSGGAAARASGIAPFGGHMSVGYGQLLISSAPGGSVSFSGGVDYPVVPSLRFGVDVGYDLLGSNSVDRGSLSATVSYSAFELVAFAHWLPTHLGPLHRVSVGPMLMAAHGDLSAAAGGAGFSDLAVSDTAPGAALELTAMSGKPSPVRVGLQLGGRVGFVQGENWTILSARLSLLY